jgi:hypothetical protein
MPDRVKIQSVGFCRLPAVMAKIPFEAGITVFTRGCHTMLLIALKNIYGDCYVQIYESVG